MKKLVKNIAETVSDFYGFNDVNCDSDVIADIVSDGVANKLKLWDVIQSLGLGTVETEKLRVAMPITLHIEPDRYRVSDEMRGVFAVVEQYTKSFDDLQRGVCRLLAKHSTATITAELVPLWHYIGFDKVRAGQKLTRAFHKHCINLSVNDEVFMCEIDERLTLLGERMKSKDVLETIYISVNPYDMARMSNGNSWDSCHAVDGCHCGGTIGLMQDGTTAIIYTEKANSDQLVSRALLHAVDDLVIIPKVYGDYSDIFDLGLRRIMAKFKDIYSGSECNLGLLERHIDSKSTAYLDAERMKLYGIKVAHPFNHGSVSAPQRCLLCGKLHNYEDSLHCGHCDNMAKCYTCGDYHDVNDLTTVDNALYCDDCLIDQFTWVESREEFYPHEYVVHVESSDSYELLDDVTYCVNCGEWHLYDDISNVDGDNLCVDCFIDNYTYCDSCYDPINCGDVLSHGNGYYCPECYDAIKEDEGEMDTANALYERSV